MNIQEVKKILGDDTLSDKDAVEIRDTFEVLADIILDQWLDDMQSTGIKNNPVIKNNDGMTASNSREQDIEM